MIIIKDKIIELFTSIIASLGSIWQILNFAIKRDVIDLITSLLLFLIALGGFGRIYFGWTFPLVKKYPKIFPKSKPERTYLVSAEKDFENLKGVVKMLLKIKNLINMIAKSTWANKLSLTDDLLVTAAWLGIGHNFLEEYGYTFKGQPWHFWVITVFIVISYILVIIGINHVGLETWEKWKARIGNKEVNNLINQILNFGIDKYPDKAQTILNKVKVIYNEINTLLDTDTKRIIENKINEIQEKIDYELAERTLEEEKRKERLIALAKEKKVNEVAKNDENMSVRSVRKRL